MNKVKLKKNINITIKKQLYLILSIALFIPTLVVGCYLIMNTRHLLLSHYYDQTAADSLRVKNIMLEVTTTLSIIADDIFTDEQLQKLLSSNYTSTSDAQKELSKYKKLSDYLSDYTQLSSINVYTTNASIPEQHNFLQITEEIAQQNWYKEALSQPNIIWSSATKADSHGTKKQELTLYYRIPILKTQEYAILVISVSNNYLKSIIEQSDLLTSISVNTMGNFYNSDHSDWQNSIYADQIDQRNYNYQGISTYHGRESIVSITTFVPVSTNDRLIIITNNINASEEIEDITLTCLVIIVFSMIFPIVLIILYTKKFTNRLYILRREMHRVSNGDYNIITDFTGNDELSELFTDLKTMIESIMQKDMELYQDKITQQHLINHQQKMEFDILASQINPHFLYNTLETIRMKSLAQNNKEVATAIKQLGQYLRHNLETSGTVTTLKRELEYIEIYLQIQQLRFGDRVNYQFHFSPEVAIDSYQILSLLLQPIIENSIIHGLENTEENGLIEINIYPQNSFLIIEMKDNGDGMSEDILKELIFSMQQKDKQEKSSYGLYNIHHRIQLFYGEKYGLDIESTEAVGTTVTIRLPLHYTWR
ncbi:sensor histidine kinase [Anaeromicropila populeti]|uniref:histidine kinase n=1 Tax=Anaeromicropila populeti TaxID=37658 RepID=A0A1I6J9F9_9FIRM|nr:histidine kinase [Anaeromicropila populeti]SFR75589.1 two-component system, sensor histidine kinase YesM [Anaeromicropila populeti]